MIPLITVKSKLRCNHGNEVLVGPGSDALRVGGQNILRVADVVRRPVTGCRYCTHVVDVTFGFDSRLRIRDTAGLAPATDAGSPALTRLAFGTTNAGVWRVDEPETGRVHLALGILGPRAGLLTAPKEPDLPADDPHDDPTLSGPLRVTAWRAYRSSDPDTFRPDLTPVDPDRAAAPQAMPVRDRWLYLYDAEGRRRFLGEYLAHSDGMVREVRAGLRAAGDATPPSFGPPVWLRVKLGRNRAPKKYLILISALRLTRRVADRWAARPEPHVATIGPKTKYAVGTDPLVVADWLGHVYSRWCDLLLGEATWLGPDLHQTQGPARALLARLLIPMLDDARLDLVDDLRDGGRPLRMFLQDYEERVRMFAVAAERAAEELTRWLQSGFWKEVEAAYAVLLSNGCTEDTFHYMLATFAAGGERLPESVAGRRYLDRLYRKEWRTHFLWEFVTRTKPAPEGVFKAVKKVPDAAVGLWAMALKWAATETKQLTLEVYVPSLFHLFRMEVSVGGLWRVRDVSVGIHHGSVRWVDVGLVEDRFRTGLAKLDLAAEEGKLLAKTKSVFAALNFGLAYYKLRTDPSLKLETTLAVIGAATELGASGLKFTGEHKQLGKFLSSVTAVCTFINAEIDRRKAVRHDDPGLQLGSAMIEVGTVAGLIGTWLGEGALLGVAGSWWTGVGALMAIGGYVAVVLLAKTEIELFARHCEWGTIYHAPGSGRPKWSPHAYAAWKDQPERQLLGLLRLLAVFKVTGLTARKVRIELGVTFPGTRIEVVFSRGLLFEKDYCPGYVVEWESGKVSHLAEWDQVDANATPFDRKDDDHGRSVTIEVPEPGGWHFRTGAKCWVRVDLLGSGEVIVPGPDAWVEIRLLGPLSSEPDRGVVSSLDFDCNQIESQPRRS